MSEKQDRTYARTAQDIERKYSFGKTFADMLGLVNDNRDKVDSVESTLRSEIAYSQETTLKRTSEEIVATAKAVGDSVDALSKQVEMKLNADAVKIEIDKAIANGVDRVVTKTGYKFDADGLNISKSDSEISNTLNHEGMYVKKSGENVLVADAKGVAATDLHAKTYLIIGGRSRLENYGIDRTGCFWIGG